jgi:hypothetical protein
MFPNYGYHRLREYFDNQHLGHIFRICPQEFALLVRGNPQTESWTGVEKPDFEVGYLLPP